MGVEIDGSHEDKVALERLNHAHSVFQVPLFLTIDNLPNPL